MIRYLILWLGYSFAFLCAISFFFAAASIVHQPSADARSVLVDMALMFSPIAGICLVYLNYKRATPTQ